MNLIEKWTFKNKAIIVLWVLRLIKKHIIKFHFVLEEPKQIGVETTLVVEKQENKSGFTLQAEKMLNTRRDDSIQSEKEAQTMRQV